MGVPVPARIRIGPGRLRQAEDRLGYRERCPDYGVKVNVKGWHHGTDNFLLQIGSYYE